MTPIADAIRTATAKMQHELDSGRRSNRLDAYDLVDILLAIADELDPPFPPSNQPPSGL
jgi:chorismate mutase